LSLCAIVESGQPDSQQQQQQCLSQCIQGVDIPSLVYQASKENEKRNKPVQLCKYDYYDVERCEAINEEGHRAPITITMIITHAHPQNTGNAQTLQRENYNYVCITAATTAVAAAVAEPQQGLGHAHAWKLWTTDAACKARDSTCFDARGLHQVV
jgi:hypothetical protein